MPVYTKYSDQQLSALLKEGDERAYTEIYNRYWQTIYTIAYNRLRNMEAAQDLVHDTFVSLWTSREKADIENLKAYLAVATKYRVIEYLRREKLQNSYEQHMITPTVLNAGLEESIHYKEILGLLEKEIETLPEKCKLIFKTSRNQNKSAKTIAQELNLSQSTVENQINKALTRLRVVLKNINVFSLFFFMIYLSVLLFSKSENQPFPFDLQFFKKNDIVA